MSIILCQHGEAYTKEENLERPLTQSGRIKVKINTERAFKNRKKPDIIFHSQKLRAIQTAEIIAQTLGLKGILKEREGLNPNDNPELFLESLDTNKDIFIVGHLPFLKKMTSLLTTSNQDFEIIRFQMGCLINFEKNENNNLWHILWAEF